MRGAPASNSGDGVVGSMSAHWEEWRKAGAFRAIVQWLRAGIPLILSRPPRPSLGLDKMQTQQKEITEETSSLVRSGAFISQDTKFISPTFCIPKRGGRIRLIHDLRNINSALTPPKFTLHGAGDAVSVTRDSQWLAVLDLKHGYQQVAVDIRARKYLGGLMGRQYCGINSLAIQTQCESICVYSNYRMVGAMGEKKIWPSSRSLCGRLFDRGTIRGRIDS